MSRERNSFALWRWCGWRDSNPHGLPPEPKSGASTNFATSASEPKHIPQNAPNSPQI
ncbi:No hit [Brucella canis HSK A52141]|nr:No hit [Brucella canis HSK A52141]